MAGTASGKILVVYYSLSGNTGRVARDIARLTRADVEVLRDLDREILVSFGETKERGSVILQRLRECRLFTKQRSQAFHLARPAETEDVAADGTQVIDELRLAEIDRPAQRRGVVLAIACIDLSSTFDEQPCNRHEISPRSNMQCPFATRPCGIRRRAKVQQELDGLFWRGS